MFPNRFVINHKEIAMTEPVSATRKEPSLRALAFARSALLEAGDPAGNALADPPRRRARPKDGQAHHDDHHHHDHYH
jgi:hypothetical protein